MDTANSTIHASCSRGTFCQQCLKRAKHRIASQRWRQNNPEKRNRHHKSPRAIQARSHQKRYHLYGITIRQYAEILALQGGRCFLCREGETAVTKDGMVKALHIDHDHATGQIRGLLCQRCNHALATVERHGMLWIYRAIVYLS